MKLLEILRRVASDETFTITNQSKPVADLIPSKSGDYAKTETAIRNILKTQKHKVSDQALKDLMESGRK